ncbi:MAG: translation elongation factor Ts [Methyloligellaceae bacterium]
MAQITAALVKELRDKTGAGMMDCKKALTETDGGMDDAVDWLRKNGLAAAAKKSGRVASEGLIGVSASGTSGAIVEVNAETDFVSRNDAFQAFVEQVATITQDLKADVDAIAEADYPGTGRTVQEELTHNIATIGENMSLRRAAYLAVDAGVVASYVHSAMRPGLGKIGVLVALESEADTSKLEALGKQLAMHIAAARPEWLSTEHVSGESLERERKILAEQAAASGKPAEIIEKMVEGRLRKYYQEVVLHEQTFVIDNESKIAKVVENAAKEVGAPIEISGFVRFELGEGIDKGDDPDFAAEVASLTQ